MFYLILAESHSPSSLDPPLYHEEAALQQHSHVISSPLQPSGLQGEVELPTFAVDLTILVCQGGRLKAFATLGASEAGLMPGLGKKGSG